MKKQKKVYIDIDDVLIMQRIRKRINKPNLSDIVWVRNGKEISVPKGLVDKWRWCGLSNCDFITSGAYKQDVFKITKTGRAVITEVKL